MKKQGGVTAFGDYLRDLMVSRSITLRALARESGIDVSNLSKIERGLAYPPQKKKPLENLANALNASVQERQKLFELAAHVNGLIPEDLQHVRQNKAIPLLLRAINNRQLSEKKIEELAAFVEKENEWQGRVMD